MNEEAVAHWGLLNTPPPHTHTQIVSSKAIIFLEYHFPKGTLAHMPVPDVINPTYVN